MRCGVLRVARKRGPTDWQIFGHRPGFGGGEQENDWTAGVPPLDWPVRGYLHTVAEPPTFHMPPGYVFSPSSPRTEKGMTGVGRRGCESALAMRQGESFLSPISPLLAWQRVFVRRQYRYTISSRSKTSRPGLKKRPVNFTLGREHSAAAVVDLARAAANPWKGFSQGRCRGEWSWTPCLGRGPHCSNVGAARNPSVYLRALWGSDRKARPCPVPVADACGR